MTVTPHPDRFPEHRLPGGSSISLLSKTPASVSWSGGAAFSVLSGFRELGLKPLRKRLQSDNLRCADDLHDVRTRRNLQGNRKSARVLSIRNGVRPSSFGTRQAPGSVPSSGDPRRSRLCLSILPRMRAIISGGSVTRITGPKERRRISISVPS